MSSTERAEIEKLVRAHGDNFLNRDADALIKAFDADYACVTHLPTEADTYLRSYDEIRDYYQAVCLGFKPTRWDIQDLLVDFPGDGVAFALCRVFVDYRIEGRPESELIPLHAPKGYWEGRCRYIFRRGDAGWKIIHLEDSTRETFRPDQVYEYHEMIADTIQSAVEKLRRSPGSGNES